MLKRYLLKNLKFPLNVEGKKDKKSELLEVGQLVAELNSWQYDEEVTKMNHNKGQIRLIFNSVHSGQTAYLSVDVKNPYGRFELHDRNGKHAGEIDFENGYFQPRGASTKGVDDSGRHDIKVKR